jgi:hypothetical protein
MPAVDGAQVHRFIEAAGAIAEEEGVCYLTGGATAVLLGWRDSTLDIDVRFVPEQDRLMRELQRLKRELQLNVETASPGEFIPLPAGWEDRSPFIARAGRLTFRHFDLYSQVLAKIERGHAKDVVDVTALLERGDVLPERLQAMYDEIEPQLYRFPAVSPEGFRRRVEQLTRPA